MSTPSNRVGKGVPTGGQFAASAHAESGVSLRRDTPPSSTPDPKNLCDLALAQTRPTRERRNAAQKAGDRAVAQAEQARLDVLGEVSIMVSRTDLEPDYSMSTEWRRIALRLGRDNIGAEYGNPRDITLDHARACRDFCFTQAARFGVEARVAPDERDRDWMDDFEWENQVADHAYTKSLANAYAYWALAFDQARHPDLEPLLNLMDAVEDRSLGVPHRFPGDVAPDLSEQWARATGTTSHIEDHYPSTPPSVG